MHFPLECWGWCLSVPPKPHTCRAEAFTSWMQGPVPIAAERQAAQRGWVTRVPGRVHLRPAPSFSPCFLPAIRRAAAPLQNPAMLCWATTVCKYEPMQTCPSLSCGCQVLCPGDEERNKGITQRSPSLKPALCLMRNRQQWAKAHLFYLHRIAGQGGWMN